MNDKQSFLPGSVHPQYVKCGKPGCKCARGELHGPYWYHFHREGGRLVKRYVRPQDLDTTREECKAWRDLQDQLREGRARWKELNAKMRLILRLTKAGWM